MWILGTVIQQEKGCKLEDFIYLKSQTRSLFYIVFLSHFYFFLVVFFGFFGVFFWGGVVFWFLFCFCFLGFFVGFFCIFLSLPGHPFWCYFVALALSLFLPPLDSLALESSLTLSASSSSSIAKKISSFKSHMTCNSDAGKYMGN